MYGVSRITSTSDVMLITLPEADAAFMAKTLQALGQAGVVLDMICQTTPLGGNVRFCFTASAKHFDTALRTIGAEKPAHGGPMVSAGYAKINLFGEEMVESVGVAARALTALGAAGIDIALITTSDLDISLLLRSEDEDVGLSALRQAYQI